MRLQSDSEIWASDRAVRTDGPHVPVLLAEILRFLDPRPGQRFVDATADGGGHALAILNRIQPGGRLLAVERDPELITLLARRIERTCPHFSKNCVLVRSNYRDLERIVRNHRFTPLAGVLFDLGLSSFHLARSRRGFSFQNDEPLDMRFDPTSGHTAAELVRTSSEPELSRILSEYGGERFAPRIAREIVRARQTRPLRTTSNLLDIVRPAIPPAARHGRIHWATRMFQALRIAVNDEIGALGDGLRGAAAVLAPGGRVAVVSFHSLEDGTVKRFFRDPDVAPAFRAITASPLRPTRAEIINNPRARSARLRVYQKIS